LISAAVLAYFKIDVGRSILLGQLWALRHFSGSEDLHASPLGEVLIALVRSIVRATYPALGALRAIAMNITRFG